MYLNKSFCFLVNNYLTFKNYQIMQNCLGINVRRFKNFYEKFMI